MTRKLDGPRFAAGGLGTAILDSAHALVITLDVEGRIAGFNRACELLTGYSASEVIGTRIWDKLLPDEAIEPIQRFFAGLPEGGEIPEEHENAWVTRDGRRPIIAWNNNALRNAKGEVELVVGIGVDITGRKAAGERLAHAQRMARIGSWEWTIETDEEKWSDQFFVNLGLEPGSVKPSVEEFYKYVHPGDRDAVKRNVLRATERKQPYSADYRVIWPDGTERLVHEEVETILDGGGKAIALAGTMQDVTELHETENQLQRLATRLEYAQRVARIGNWEWDAATDRQWWSDECYRLVGYQPGEVEATDENFFAVIHPDDFNRARSDIDTAEKNGKAYEFTCRVNLRDGTERVVREVGYPAYNDNGKYVGQNGTLQDITEQYRAEQDLANTAHRLKEAERIANLGNWEWEPESDRLSLSDQTYRLIGLEPGSRELTNDDYLELVHPKDRQSVADLMRKTVESGGSYSTRYRVVRPDGGVRTISEIAEFFEVDGSGQRWLKGTVQDITGQHKAEQELSETAQRLEAAMRLARLGSWEWDPDTNLLKNSEETLRICGLGPEHAEVDNEFLMAMIPAEEHARVLDIMKRAVFKGEAYTNEYHIVRPDGDKRAVIEHGEAFRDETTGATRLVGTIQDITERKRAEQNLALNLRRLDESQEAAAIGSWEWDAATDQDWWSEQQFRNYGIEAPAGFVPGENYLQFAHPADREAAKQAVDRSVETGTPLDIEFRAIGADGVERVLWVYGANETNADGRVIRTVGTTQDVTIRKHAELELARTAERLEEAQRIANIGHWEWRPGSTDTIWSDETHRIFGLKPDAVQPTHDSFFSMVHEDDRESIATLMANTLKTGKPYETEFRIIRTDGAMRHIYERGERYIDEQTDEASIRGIMQDITERKKAEDEIRQSNRYLDLFFKHSLTSFILMDRDFNFIRVNDAYAKADGKEPGFFPGKNHFDIYPSEAKALFAEVRDSGKPYQALAMPFEYAEHPERGTTWWDWTLVPVAGQDDTTELMVFSLNNVTQRVQAEQALRDSEARLDAFFNEAPVGLAILDSEYRYVKVNEMLAQINEISAEAHVDKRPSEIMMQEKANLIENLLRRTLEHGEPVDREESIVPGPDGKNRSRVYTQFPLSGDPRKPDTLGVVIVDITERVQAERALRDSEERLNAFFAEAPAGLGIIDSDYRYVKLNETLARMNGLPALEQIGKRPSDFLPPEMAGMVENVLRRTLEEGEALDNEEGSAPGPDGQIHHWVFSQFPIAGDPRKPNAVGLVIIDVTELKNVQQELARLNAELEQRVEERTAELHAAQGELVKSERLSTLGQLTATVSHELRNPLGAMRTSMYVIEKKSESEDQRLRAAIERVNRNITRCDQIIDELLDFTRIRDLNIQLTDIDNWLGAILDEQSIPNGIAVKRKFGVTGTRAPIDGNRLRRAFINVFENACQAVSDPHHDSVTPDRPMVTVETRLRRDRLEIIVSDNGAGISDDIREKIFEPLFSTKNFGVGLGLPTVKQIMEQHGGGVEVGERRGGGVNFALWLPLAGELQSTNL